jgi:phosphoribosylanthranilate isomerase
MCGVCYPEDAIAAARAGADAIGMILFAKSQRLIDGEHAKSVAAAVPPMVARVGVFVDARPSFVALCARSLHLDLVQLHGTESVDFVRAIPTLSVVKAVRLSEYEQWATSPLPNLRAIVLDSAVGGSGVANDWDAVEAAIRKTPPRVPLILAGGLTPETARPVASRFRPWALDVSSGIESEPTRKSPARMDAFVRAVRDSDRASDPSA